MRSLTLVICVVSAVWAASAAPPSGPGLYYLRANCPNDVWHNRHLVELSAGSLGFENFTVHPETLPALFYLIPVDNNNYAFQGLGHGNDTDTETSPYLAALTPLAANSAIETFLKFIYLPDPSLDGIASIRDACPGGVSCDASSWTANAPATTTDGVMKRFRLSDSAGAWDPLKPWSGGGWYLFWKTHTPVWHPIQIDVVPNTQW